MKRLFTFCLFVLLQHTAFAQIPNGGFEDWTNTSGYDVPTGWDNTNVMTSRMSVYTCNKGTPGNPGASHIQLMSKTTTGITVVPGIAVCGVLDTTNFHARSGFAYTSRPTYLTGMWIYMPFGSDHGHILVLLSRWNTALNKRDTIAIVDYQLPGMCMDWAPFSLPLAYQSAAAPDSATIVLAASSSFPVNGSFLQIDNLAFSDSVATVPSGIANASANSALFLVYPNPATNGSTIVSYNSVTGNDVQVLISDINGATVATLNYAAFVGTNKLPINVTGMAKGIYTIKVIDGQNNYRQKLVIE